MNQKIPLLFVYHSMNIGGVEKELLSYLNALSSEMYDLHLALNRIEGELLSEIPNHVTIHHLPGNSILPGPLFIWNLVKVIKRVQPTYVVGFMQDINLAVLLAHTLFPLPSKPVVCELVVLSAWHQAHQTFFLKKVLVGYLYQRAYRCLCQSGSIVDDLHQNFGIPDSKLVLVPSYPYFLHQKKKSDYHTTEEKSYFLYVGRLVPEKNIEDLLKAYAQYHQAGGANKLKIVGPGMIEYYRRLAASLSLSPAEVEFVGYVKRPEPYYRQAQALILPSSVEGRSRVLIEAMYNQCLVICADYLGHERYISHQQTGLVYPVGGVDALAALMDYTDEHPKKMRGLAQEARVAILNYYSSNFKNQYADILNSVFHD